LTSIIKELKPKLIGFLHLDGKGIKIKGKNKKGLTLFIAQDSSGLPIHQDLMEGENKLAVKICLYIPLSEQKRKAYSRIQASKTKDKSFKDKIQVTIISTQIPEDIRIK